MTIYSRRAFLAGTATVAASLALSGCANSRRLSKRRAALIAPTKEAPSSTFALAYGARPNEPYPIPAIDPKRLPRKYRRALVDDPTGEKPGTVIVDTSNRYLYHVLPGGKAKRYGVGIGRAGFAWSGRAIIAYKRRWPTWTPPEEMIERQPELAKFRNGMEPGLKNPLGARALYIHQDGKDTLYRLHGTNEVGSIGKAVSSGCVRLLHQDVIHLFDNVRNGSPILVR